MRKKQQPPVGSTPVSVPSPQPSPTFSPAITIPSAAQPTVQSLQQQHSEIKEVSEIQKIGKGLKQILKIQKLIKLREKLVCFRVVYFPFCDEEY